MFAAEMTQRDQTPHDDVRLVWFFAAEMTQRDQTPHDDVRRVEILISFLLTLVSPRLPPSAENEKYELRRN